jgi:hypothetical protein
VTDMAEIRQAFTELDRALGNAITGSAASDMPHAALVASLDQVRAFVRQMGATLADEPAAGGPAGLLCAACVQQARNAEAMGQPVEAILPAVMVVNGNSWCDVRHRIATAAEVARAQASQVARPSGLLLPGQQVPPVNGHGG